MQIITKRNDSYSYNTNNIIPYVEKTPEHTDTKAS
jgi:hypothetical protein